MLARDALKEVITAQRGAILFEPPRADARDFKRSRTGLENQTQPVADGDRCASLPRRELGQRLALRRQPAFALAQLTLRGVRDLEQPVDGIAQFRQILTGAVLGDTGRPVVRLQDRARPRAHLIDALNQPQAKDPGDEQRHTKHQAADEEELFPE